MELLPGILTFFIVIGLGILVGRVFLDSITDKELGGFLLTMACVIYIFVTLVSVLNRLK